MQPQNGQILVPTPHLADSGITFYLPFRMDGVKALPVDLKDYWPWLLQNRSIKDKGKYSWTLQTYLQLREAGFDCSLSERFPSEGVVIAHRDFLPVILRPRPRVFLVCIKPDRKRHTWAHAYVVQNDNDSVELTGKEPPLVIPVPYWPQPSLIPRDPTRRDLCQNIAYLGRSVNLTPELKTTDWANQISGLGLNWSIINFEHWHDYRHIDVTVSVRSFDQNSNISNPVFNPNNKPPSKLINSWLAGVPAIVGAAESAYKSVRKDPLDYIEVANPEELLNALKELRDNKTLYRSMVSHGLQRARDYSAEAVRARWIELLQTDVMGRYKRWSRRPFLQRVWQETHRTLDYFAQAQNLKDLLTVLRP